MCAPVVVHVPHFSISVSSSSVGLGTGLFLFLIQPCTILVLTWSQPVKVLALLMQGLGLAGLDYNTTSQKQCESNKSKKLGSTKIHQ